MELVEGATADGQRFLVARPANAPSNSGSETALTVVLNWDAALR
jgi:hypothetical protein